MATEEATKDQTPPVRTLARTEADMIVALTKNTVEEALGVALAAHSAGMPIATSFTVETDGRLPAGHSLRAAIARTDDATANHPVDCMINGAHPLHFRESLESSEE